MRKKYAKIAKKLTILFVVVLILFPLAFTLIRFCIYQEDQAAPPITELSNYQNWSADGWIFDKPYSIFPSSLLLTKALNTDYLFKRVRSPLPLLYDDDAILYLVCELNETTFSDECKRLQELCGEIRDNFGHTAAYVYAVRGGGFFYEYALIDEESHRITYISFQNREFAQKYVDSFCLPNKQSPIQSACKDEMRTGNGSMP